MILVVDASVSLALLLREPEAAAVGAKLASWVDVRAPFFWNMDVAGGVLNAMRRGRLDAESAARALGEVDASPVRMEPWPGAEAVFACAQKYQLSIHDAAYLELAERLQAALATLDPALRRAAMGAGVNVL